MFDASLLAVVVASWSRSLVAAVLLGLLAASAPVLAALIQDPAELSVGIWILGVTFPWMIGRAVARQLQLAAQLDAARRELARQAVLTERRRIARDVHDLVGHGLAAVLLQVTSARHVLRRDPAAAEEALRSAEDVGRRSMNELRSTVALLRSDEERGVAPPLPSAAEIPALVDHARAAGLTVDLRVDGDLARIAPSVGVAAYRIAQEALANAARHAPHGRTVVGLALNGDRVALEVETHRAGGSRAGRRTAAVRLRPDRDARAGDRARRRARRGADTRRLAGPLPASAGDGMIRVAVVDDQAIVRAGLARILSLEDGFAVVAECANGREAVQELPALRPDVVLMDIRMPTLDGLAATAQLRAAAEPLRVLVLTTFGEDDVLWGAIEAGAAGFVLKDSSAEDLIAAVRAVAGGGAWLDPGVAPRVLDYYRRLVAPAAREAARLDSLTEREHDVLRLMARGATNAEIAAALYVAEATVKTHVGSIFAKLGVRDRPAAIVFAYDHGVVAPGASRP